METRIYLSRYEVCVDRVGVPFVIRRSAEETTLKATDLQSGDYVALQLQSAAALSQSEQKQLEAEARAGQQINHHSIPQLRDFGSEENQLIYVTECFDGITADEWVKMHGPMPPRAALLVASQAVSALVAASLHGIIHYAVNPSNIMLLAADAAGEWPRIKLLNFLGLTPSVESMRSFASPEQLGEGPVTFRSEIYSLGKTLSYLLTGSAAKAESSSSLAASVAQLLTAMQAENPADRPADPADLQERIRDCIDEVDRPASIPAPPDPSEKFTAVQPIPIEHFTRPPSAVRPFAIAAVLVLLAVAAGAVLLATRAQQTIATAAADVAIAPQTISSAPSAPPSPPEADASAELFAQVAPEESPEVTFAEASPSPAESLDVEEPVVLALDSPSPMPAVAENELAAAESLILAQASAEAPLATDEPVAEGPPDEQPSPPALAEADHPAPVSPVEPIPAQPIEQRPPMRVRKAESATTLAPRRVTAHMLPRRRNPQTSVGHILFPASGEASTDRSSSSQRRDRRLRKDRRIREARVASER